MTEATDGLPVGAGEAAQPSVLDQAQDFVSVSSYEVRDELATLIKRDLLGPWDGELESFQPRSAAPSRSAPPSTSMLCALAATSPGSGNTSTA